MTLTLPRPPVALLEQWEVPLFARSEEMEDFLRAHWIDGGGLFPSGPFAHLQAARIGVLWAGTQAPVPHSGGKITAGMAEIFEPRPGKRWIMDRQRAYMHHLFGFELPDFILTFDAQWWADEAVSIATKLSNATHELCHCGQALDEYDQPKILRTGPRKGEPVWCINAHDVEQFNLPVRWFGAKAAGVAELVRAAAAGAEMWGVVREAFGCEIGEAETFTCGTCGKAA